jgi:tetrahydromethanopterin S-methyltransferase subunit G
MIKNGLAEAKKLLEREGYKQDELDSQINELMKEVTELAMGSHFINFVRIQGAKEGFGMGTKFGIVIGIVLTFLAMLVAQLF